MADNRDPNAEPTGGQGAASGANQEPASGGEPSGATEGGGFDLGEMQTMLRKVSQKLDEVQRASQSHTDTNIARLQEEIKRVSERGSSPQQSSQLDMVAQNLRAAGWQEAQIQSLLGPAQTQYAAQQTQTYLQERQQRDQEEELRRRQDETNAYIRRRSEALGVDPESPDLDLTTAESFEESLARVALKAQEAKHKTELKTLEERVSEIERGHQEQLVKLGVMDNVSGQRVAPMSGDKGARLQELNEKLRHQKISLAAYEKAKRDLGA